MPDSERESRWEQWYRGQEVEKMPWYYPDLDPDFAAALERLGIESGTKALDLCTGPGTQALALAERGMSVTGTDISRTAVEKAAALAAARDLKVSFKQNDILNSRLKQSFDLVIDRGCFHVFPPEHRDDYVKVISGLVKPGGYLLLKCFSHKQKGSEGPYRLHPDELRRRFGGEFEIVSIEESVFRSDYHDRPPIALFLVMRRR